MEKERNRRSSERRGMVEERGVGGREEVRDGWMEKDEVRRA